jgi:hypothetical protein
MPRGSSLPRRLGDQKMPAKPLRRLACSFGQLNSFPGQPCAKARIPNGQGCGGYPLARFGAYCDGLARPRTRAEHVRANFVIVAARIRLLAALQTATHHVGGWSAVIDERVPDNHQAAERRQALAGRPPVGMVAIPPPLPGPDQTLLSADLNRLYGIEGVDFQIAGITYSESFRGSGTTMSWLGSSVRSQGSSPAHRRAAGWHPAIRALHAFSLMGTTVMAMLFCEVFGGRLRAFEGRQGRNAQEPELKSGSQRTLRWRKTDSNLWSHFQRGQRFRARHSVSRSTAPATSVLISENDDFEFPAAKVTSLAKARASC